jgi:hypothetical protein
MRIIRQRYLPGQPCTGAAAAVEILGAARRLARLWRDQGGKREAYDLKDAQSGTHGLDVVLNSVLSTDRDCGECCKKLL